MSGREDLIRAFLKRENWGNATRAALKGDASTRRYERLTLGAHTVILMDQPQEKETSACPPEATPAQRAALGYNALARLAGADCHAFAGVAAHLKALGLSAPEIYAADYAAGLMLIEDLGEELYAQILSRGADERALYENAITALSILHAAPAPDSFMAGQRLVPLLDYDDTALLAEADLLLDWFFPAALGHAPSESLREEYHALWREALLPAHALAPVLVLRDYHAENLLWLKEREAHARAGMIDFQDGLRGSPAYDLISLLEDARRDVAPEFAAAMTAHYVHLARGHNSAFHEEIFRAAAAALAAQRNVKIVGIFTRLWKRDGKPRYALYHPRLWRTLERDLAHPALARLKAWFERNVPREKRNSLAKQAERAA